MWERFSYYGMRALLTLFMVAPVASGGLGYDTKRAGLVYGTYTMSVYMLSIPGGFIADNFIGSRISVLYGGGVVFFGDLPLWLFLGGGVFFGAGLFSFAAPLF